MTQDKARPEGGANARPRDETVAQTGPGLPDEAVGPGETPIEAREDEGADEALAERVRADIGAVQGERDEARERKEAGT